MWCQKEDRVQAHIPVCFLTYVLWKILAASCREAGLGDEPRQVFEALSEIALVDVALPARSGPVVRKRCISQPTERLWILLQRLGPRLPAGLGKAAMWWKLAHAPVESKDFIDPTAEAGLACGAPGSPPGPL
ncbi:MAG: hypothetical protein ACLQIS_00130 [Bryobacteraceae bacterium]